VPGNVRCAHDSGHSSAPLNMSYRPAADTAWVRNRTSKYGEAALQASRSGAPKPGFERGGAQNAGGRGENTRARFSALPRSDFYGRRTLPIRGGSTGSATP